MTQQGFGFMVLLYFAYLSIYPWRFGIWNGRRARRGLAPIPLYCFILQIICVIVPIGQKVHHVLGLNSAITTKPNSIEVNITL